MPNAKLSLTDRIAISGKTIVQKYTDVILSFDNVNLGEQVYDTYTTLRKDIPEDFDNVLMSSCEFKHAPSLILDREAKRIKDNGAITPGLFDPIFSARISNFYRELYGYIRSYENAKQQEKLVPLKVV